MVTLGITLLLYLQLVIYRLHHLPGGKSSLMREELLGDEICPVLLRKTMAHIVHQLINFFLTVIYFSNIDA